jgi:hypothetical protein
MTRSEASVIMFMVMAIMLILLFGVISIISILNDIKQQHENADKSVGSPLKIDWDKLSKEQQDEFLKRIIMPNYDNPFQPIYTPCYAPNGICTNPQMDCINCPKRGTGGAWSTSINTNKEE